MTRLFNDPDKYPKIDKSGDTDEASYKAIREMIGPNTEKVLRLVGAGKVVPRKLERKAIKEVADANLELVTLH